MGPAGPVLSWPDKQISECCAHRREPPHIAVMTVVKVSVESRILDIFLIALKSPLFISLVNIHVEVLLQSCLGTNNPTLSSSHVFGLQPHLPLSWCPFEGTI